MAFSINQFKHDDIKHPYLKRKVKVIDVFQSKWNLVCPNCNVEQRHKLVVTQGDERSKQYVVLDCDLCLNQSWFIDI